MRDRIASDIQHPSEIDEFAQRNFWFGSVGFDSDMLTPPLQHDMSVDIAVVGGGFTGLASAYHLATHHPDKKIVLLERGCCGWGASGRNGGFADTGIRGLWKICAEQGPEAARPIYDITRDGLASIRRFVEEHGVDCDFAPNGSMEMATEESHIAELHEEKRVYDALGLEAAVLDSGALRQRLKSGRYLAALWYPDGATVNPFKLARGMKRVVEEKNVDIYERTAVVKIEPGTPVTVVTESGRVRADALVLATNGYSAALGFFKRRIIPMCTYIIATTPLSEAQLASIGWAGREKLSDMRPFFNYFHLSADNRIIFGGEGARYNYGGALCKGEHQPTFRKLRSSLFQSFPQLEGIDITHAWGGTLGMSLDLVPSVGMLGENPNIFYALGYSGEGVVLSQVAGRIINELYSGNENVLTRVFLVNKPVPYSGPEPFRYLAISGYRAYLRRFGAKVTH
jgi:glycine/D-amino acid oxidase-like deaminating enzyme